EIGRDLGQLASLVEIIDGLNVDLTIISFSVTGIGDVKSTRTVRHDVVRTVKLFSLKLLSDDSDFPGEVSAGHSPIAAFTGDECSGRGKEKAIRFPALLAKDSRRLGCWIVDVDPFVRDVREIDLPVWR